MKWEKGEKWIKEHLKEFFEQYDVPPPCQHCENLYIGVVSEEYNAPRKDLEIMLLRDEAYFAVGCNTDDEDVCEDFDECIEDGMIDQDNNWTKTPFIHCHETGDPHIACPRWLAKKSLRLPSKEGEVK